MPKTRPAYLEQFRREAVELVCQGPLGFRCGSQPGVSQQSLRTWAKQEQADRGDSPGEALSSAEREELKDLRRRVRRLEQERDILKRATALFARELER